MEAERKLKVGNARRKRHERRLKTEGNEMDGENEIKM